MVTRCQLQLKFSLELGHLRLLVGEQAHVVLPVSSAICGCWSVNRSLLRSSPVSRANLRLLVGEQVLLRSLLSSHQVAAGRTGPCCGPPELGHHGCWLSEGRLMLSAPSERSLQLSRKWVSPCSIGLWGQSLMSAWLVLHRKNRLRYPVAAR
jgi:hypothetical protein